MLYNFSVTPIATDHFEERVSAIVDDVRRRVYTMPLFSMTLTPEGDPVWDKASALAEAYARYRERLQPSGVPSGILVQASLGHGYTVTPAPFQRYINLTDGAADFAYCPLDERFIEHFAGIFKMLAATHPHVIMLDDDFRLLMRGGHGCACPRHLDALARRSGVRMTREELLEHLRTHPIDDPLTRHYTATQREALMHAATVWRAAIDEIDPTIRGINCTSGQLCESVAHTNPIFKGEGNPSVVRVPNGCYAPYSVRAFSDGMRQAAVCGQTLRRRGIDVILAETDTIPFNRYAKSAAYLHAHFASSLLEGLKGAKHWLTRTTAYEPASGRAYRDILSRHAGMYERLCELADELTPVGVCCLYKQQDDFDFSSETIWQYQKNAFATGLLERIGLPFYFAEAADTCLLEDDTARHMSDEELRALFARSSVFVDGACAVQLCARGMGELLGVDARPWDGDVIHAEAFDESLARRCTKQYRAVRLTPTQDGVECLSYNIHRTREGARPLAPAVTVWEREKGQLSVAFCGTPDAPFTYGEGFAFLNETRKEQLVTLLRRAHALPVYAVGDDELCLRAGRLSDGRLLVALYLLGIDAMPSVRLYFEDAPQAITRLTPAGEEEPVAYRPCGEGVYELALGVRTLLPQILFIRA